MPLSQTEVCVSSGDAICRHDKVGMKYFKEEKEMYDHINSYNGRTFSTAEPRNESRSSFHEKQAEEPKEDLNSANENGAFERAINSSNPCKTTNCKIRVINNNVLMENLIENLEKCRLYYSDVSMKSKMENENASEFGDHQDKDQMVVRPEAWKESQESNFGPRNPDEVKVVEDPKEIPAEDTMELKRSARPINSVGDQSQFVDDLQSSTEEGRIDTSREVGEVVENERRYEEHLDGLSASYPNLAFQAKSEMRNVAGQNSQQDDERKAEMIYPRTTLRDNYDSALAIRNPSDAETTEDAGASLERKNIWTGFITPLLHRDSEKQEKCNNNFPALTYDVSAVSAAQGQLQEDCCQQSNAEDRIKDSRENCYVLKNQAAPHSPSTKTQGKQVDRFFGQGIGWNRKPNALSDSFSRPVIPSNTEESESRRDYLKDKETVSIPFHHTAWKKDSSRSRRYSQKSNTLRCVQEGLDEIASVRQFGHLSESLPCIQEEFWCTVLKRSRTTPASLDLLSPERSCGKHVGITSVTFAATNFRSLASNRGESPPQIPPDKSQTISDGNKAVKGYLETTKPLPNSTEESPSLFREQQSREEKQIHGKVPTLKYIVGTKSMQITANVRTALLNFSRNFAKISASRNGAKRYQKVCDVDVRTNDQDQCLTFESTFQEVPQFVEVAQPRPGIISDVANDPPGQQSVYIPPGDHRKETYRLFTFESFPKQTPINAPGLAKNGFFYTGFYDRVKCYSCGRNVEHWAAGDNPSDKRWHKQDCQFARGVATDNIPIGGLFSSAVFGRPSSGGASSTAQPMDVGSSQLQTYNVPRGVDVTDLTRSGGKYEMQPNDTFVIRPTSMQTQWQPPRPQANNLPARNPPRQWRMANVIASDHKRYLTNLYLNREIDSGSSWIY